MKVYPIVLVLAWGCLTPLSLRAQAVDATKESPDDEEAIHNELRALRTALTAAIAAGNVEQQLPHVHKNVVATWQNNEVVRGRDRLREFLGKKDSGEERVFQGYQEPPTADELTILYGGDTGIAFGSSVPHYKILGMEFDLENRWTATLVKEDGRWLIASYHVSANVLDNPVLSIAKKAAYWSGGIALVVGIVLGMFGDIVVRKLRKRTT
jgi:ketosteroid isomerase-like protein